MSRTQSTSNRIAFVGSGPGDPGLLTVRATEALRNAPLVITDPDVPEDVLALTADGAEVRPAVGDPAQVAKELIAEASAGRAVVRIVLRDGVATVTASPLGPPPGPSHAVVAHRPPGWWRHKWADRTALAAIETHAAPAVPLFVAADGTVLETSRGNVFLVCGDGTLVTPPLRDDLLPGVTRRAVLDLARDTGRPTELREFDLAELVRHAAFWTSSLSGAVPIRSVDGTRLSDGDAIAAEFAQVLLDGGRRGR